MEITSKELNELTKGLIKFRQQLVQPYKDADNPFFRSKYVPLPNVVDAIDKALVDTGLTYTQYATANEKAVSVTTILFHESGQFIQFAPLTLPAVKLDPQAVGSAVTYARRYALCAVFGITEFDDDAEGAMNHNNKPTKQSKPAPKPKTANKARIQTVKTKISKLASDQGIDPAGAEKMILKYFKINGTLDECNEQELGKILNYLNSK